MGVNIDQLGKLIVAKREHEMLGVRAAAKAIGTSPASLSRIENGQVPDLETFAAICQWLEIDPNEFLGMKVSEKNEPPAMVHLRKDKTTRLETAQALGALILSVQDAIRDRNLA